MPELPEVETVRKALEESLLGQRVIAATVFQERLRKPIPASLARGLEGKVFRAFGRRAKYLTVELSDNLTWLIHLGMSGSLRFLREGELTGVHDHLLVTTQSGMQVCYRDPRKFGLLDLCPTTHLPSHPLLKKIAPEPLSVALTPAIFHALLQKTKRPIKEALLDQAIIAGVGNIYACESLWLAQISPYKGAAYLTLEEAGVLLAAIQSVLQKSIAAGGSTLKDYLQPDGTLGSFQNNFAVYSRVGEPCPRPGCKSVITRVSQGGRSTFLCNSCQAP